MTNYKDPKIRRKYNDELQNPRIIHCENDELRRPKNKALIK
jgi:hypothetical protein